MSASSTALPRPAPTREAEHTAEESSATEAPWQTIVWNDPVNLMSYVTYVFQKLFGYSQQKATKLMLDVHHKGRATVSSGSKEKVEADVAKLHAAGLWATMQKA
ncbi:MAG: ATP-dependent Clp protease adapter ClpS [Actinomycetota bacterium]|nr:ATP-dependent Clp protease adapter ClpS [Actinomycetota bacterium]